MSTCLTIQKETYVWYFYWCSHHVYPNFPLKPNLSSLSHDTTPNRTIQYFLSICNIITTLYTNSNPKWPTDSTFNINHQKYGLYNPLYHFKSPSASKPLKRWYTHKVTFRRSNIPTSGFTIFPTNFEELSVENPFFTDSSFFI